MLSGGLDSSLIVALMAEQMSEPVKTFAVGFAGSPTSELADAREVAAILGPITTSSRSSSRGRRGSTSSSGTWTSRSRTCRLSASSRSAGSPAQHVTVALSGQGADELFAGYQHHLHAPLARLWERVPGALGPPLLALARRGPSSARRFAEVAGAGDAVDRALVAKTDRDDAELAALLGTRDTRDRAVGHALSSSGAEQVDPLAAALAIDAQLGLPDDMLHYFDRGSMAHSLEVRVPFLDHPFVEQLPRPSPPISSCTAGRRSTFCARRHAGSFPTRSSTSRRSVSSTRA